MEPFSAKFCPVCKSKNEPSAKGVCLLRVASRIQP